MADELHELVLDAPLVEITSSIPVSRSEQAILKRWDSDIQRAAHYRARRVYSGTADADDLAQEARIQVLTMARVAPQAPVQYVRTVIANAILGAAQREARAQPRCLLPLEDLGEELPAPTLVDTEDKLNSVTQWASRLPRRLRSVYQLLYAEDHTQRDAAKILGISQPRIAQLHRKLLDMGRAGLMDLAA